MQVGANVKSIQALGEWKGSLKRFVRETQEILQSAERSIRHTEEWLRERLNFWRYEVEQRREELLEARSALRCCEAHDNRNSSTEEERVLEAQRRLRQAEEELQNTQRWIHRLGEMMVAYRVQAQRLRRLLNTDCARADAFLGWKIADLQAFVAMAPPAEGEQTPSSVSRSLPRAVGDPEVVGTPEEVYRMRDGLTRLSKARSGSHIYQTICEWDVTVCFGDLPEDRIAQCTPEEITINEKVKDVSGNVLAAILAHEGSHLTGKPNSIHEEYLAFKAQATVWEEIKSSQEGDSVCDGVSRMISLGEQDAKGEIRRRYYKERLPENA